jgi:hypothetical protein
MEAGAMATRSKISQGLEIKSADRGEVSAVIATLNVRDLDGDVATEETFTDGEEVVISSYNHASMQGYALPVGKGKVRVTSAEAILDGKFWIDNTPEARSSFEVVKQMGARQEWSYGYKIMEAEPGVFDGEQVQFLKRVEVFEASPVIRGAGIGTRTLSAKGLKEDTPESIERARSMSDYRAAIRPHDTAVTEGKWSPQQLLIKLGDHPSILDLRSVYAWCDPTADPEMKSSYRYPHHDFPGGPANLRACMLGIAKANGATLDGPEIPDNDRRGVYNHLAAHMLEAERTPSPLSGGKGPGPKFNDRVIAAIAGIAEITGESGNVITFRRSKGRASHTSETALLLEWLMDSTKELRSQLDTPQEDAARELARFIQLSQQLGA